MIVNKLDWYAFCYRCSENFSLLKWSMIFISGSMDFHTMIFRKISNFFPCFNALDVLNINQQRQRLFCFALLFDFFFCLLQSTNQITIDHITISANILIIGKSMESFCFEIERKDFLKNDKTMFKKQQTVTRRG